MHIIKSNSSEHPEVKLHDQFILWTSVPVKSFDVGEKVFIYNTIGKGKGNHATAGLMVHGVVIEIGKSRLLNEKYKQGYRFLHNKLGIVIQNLHPSTVPLRNPVITLPNLQKHFATQIYSKDQTPLPRSLKASATFFRVKNAQDEKELLTLWQHAIKIPPSNNLSNLNFAKTKRMLIKPEPSPKKQKMTEKVLFPTDLPVENIPVIKVPVTDFFKGRFHVYDKTANTPLPETIQQTGHYGEYLVFKKLIQHYSKKNPGYSILRDKDTIVILGNKQQLDHYIKINWYNKLVYQTESYTKVKCDIKIKKVDFKGLRKRYVEVKGTHHLATQNSLMTFSEPEITLMKTKQSAYRMYRVYGVGKPIEQQSIYQIKDLHQLFTKETPFKLCLKVTLECPAQC